MKQLLSGGMVKPQRRFMTIGLIVATGLLIVLCVRARFESYHTEECIATIRERSDSNPIISRLKEHLDSVAMLTLKSTREYLKDSTYNIDYVFGRVLLSTRDSHNGIVTYYYRDSVITRGVSFGQLRFYRYRIRNGVLTTMRCSSTIGMAGNASNPNPQWEQYDENAFQFLRNFNIIDENCNVVDSMLIKPDGEPASWHFHDP